MLTATLKGVVERFGLQGQRLGEVAAGAVLKHTRDFNLTRDASLSSGLAPETPAYDVQQACATSLESAILVGNKIAVGQIEVGIAGGVDSASDAPIAISERLRQLALSLNRAKGGLVVCLRVLSRLRPSMLVPSVPNVNERRTGLSMGEHCEQMVRRWHISRAAQDELALASHTRGLQAYANGFYEGLGIPYLGLTRDNNLRRHLARETCTPTAGVRSSLRILGMLTAGNSTPLTDGAAAVLLASEQWASRQPPSTGRHGLWMPETAAVDYFGPSAEGLLMAPAYAVPRLLDRNGLTLQDFEYYQIHEAFTGQVLCTLAAWESDDFCRSALGRSTALGGIDRARLNINGGSVGLGHPFAATGAQILGGSAKQLALHRQRSGRAGRTLVSGSVQRADSASPPFWNLPSRGASPGTWSIRRGGQGRSAAGARTRRRRSRSRPHS